MEIALIGGGCVLLATISFVSTLNTPCAPSSQAGLFRSAGMDVLYFSLWALSAFLIFWACVRLRPRTFGWGPVLMGHLLLAASIPFMVEVGQRASHTAVQFLWPSSNSCDCGGVNLGAILSDLQFLNEFGPYFVLLIFGLGRYKYFKSRAQEEQARRFEREAEQLRAQLSSARLEALRMQINPHFLFNTLNTVSTMAGDNPEGIRNAMARLSEMLRYALSTSEQQEVPLDKELDVLDSYLEIQKIRLDDQLQTSIDVDPDVRRALVPTLFLQPLAENAVQHGFKGKNQGGHLAIQAWRDDDELVLVVADDGVGLTEEMSPSPLSENGHGLPNLAERLESLYGVDASLRFERSDEGGLKVVIRLPFHLQRTDQNLHVTGVASE